MEKLGLKKEYKMHLTTGFSKFKVHGYEMMLYQDEHRREGEKLGLKKEASTEVF